MHTVVTDGRWCGGERPHDLILYETGVREEFVNLYLKTSEVLSVTIDKLLAEYDASFVEEKAVKRLN